MIEEEVDTCIDCRYYDGEECYIHECITYDDSDICDEFEPMEVVNATNS